MKVLLTGATGKVGQNCLARLASCEKLAGARTVILCHNRTVASAANTEVIQGSLSDPETIAKAMDGVTHVIHMAAVKESPNQVIDVAIKGLFLLLEQARQSPSFEQVILIGGDCSVGHIFHSYDAPITEASPRRAYQGCYALTKVLEEVMLEQYQIQYDLNGCILRAPWIMEKDDFKYALSFGAEQFGGPLWTEFMSSAQSEAYAKAGKVPLLNDIGGVPLKRNFVHVDDLVSAIFAALDNPSARQSLFNISANEPVDYGRVAAHLKRTRDIEAVTIDTPYHSNWLDNSKARLQLGWEPQNDFEALIERAWSYQRAANDPRKIWYPG